MKNKVRLIKYFVNFSFVIILGLGVFFVLIGSLQAQTNLNGRILLQVQDKGQAWYVNPLNSRRYYLGRPSDAYEVMRSLGLGISNADLESFLLKAPSRLAGRILLKVQDKGQAYYVNPLDLKLYYLGRPTDAFNLMRQQGLGITTADLNKIPIAYITPPAASSGHFTFKYQNINRELSLPLSATWFKAYEESPKTYYYPANNPPLDLRESFYGLFLKLKTGDTSLDDLISNAKKIAIQNNWSEDELVEFILALVQYIPYDNSKVSAGVSNNPFYPYETLYLNRGVCSDKTFLAVALLRRLGYGAAILDFADINHTAVGLSCPLNLSLNNSGYCYVETTNYFPLGVIPQAINGQAQTATADFANLFNPLVLGQIEIKQATLGKVYQGVTLVRAKVESLKSTQEDLKLSQAEIDNLDQAIANQEKEVNTMKAQMDIYYNGGQLNQYNDLVPAYNNLVDSYNSALEVYKGKINTHNLLVKDFNKQQRDFYQQ